MRSAVHLLEVRDGHVGVDLSAFDVLVPNRLRHSNPSR